MVAGQGGKLRRVQVECRIGSAFRWELPRPRLTDRVDATKHGGTSHVAAHQPTEPGMRPCGLQRQAAASRADQGEQVIAAQSTEDARARRGVGTVSRSRREAARRVPVPLATNGMTTAPDRSDQYRTTCQTIQKENGTQVVPALATKRQRYCAGAARQAGPHVSSMACRCCSDNCLWSAIWNDILI